MLFCVFRPFKKTFTSRRVDRKMFLFFFIKNIIIAFYDNNAH